MFGIGILILGKSGIGKSESALDLVRRGSRLVADDLVEIRRNAGSKLSGCGPAAIKYHMEIRGLGIINVEELFGIGAVSEEKEIDLVVELVEWKASDEYDRVGIEQKNYAILDVEIPMVTIPVSPGRNITTVIEVAARNRILQMMGRYPALEFQERLFWKKNE